MPSHSSILSALALSGLLACGGAGTAVGQGIEQAEAETALKAALRQVRELQAQLERETVAREAMAAHAAESAAELERVRGELAELRLRVEAFGPDIFSRERGLDQRLLDAASDLRLSEEAREELTGRLHALCEAAVAYLHAPAAEQPALRDRLQQALVEASPAPEAPGEPLPRRIEHSAVVSTRPDQHLIVLDAGAGAGLKVGTPLRVFRDDRPVASALVLDVRPRISGALVTRLASQQDFPKVGDRLRIDTQN